MPTGYTAKVDDGSLTDLRDYMLICARAFGALIMMRDDPLDAPIPEKLEPSTRYYDERIADLTAEIADLTAMTADQALTKSLAHNDGIRQRHREYEASEQVRLHRHLAMIEKVQAWTPPTPDHVEYKEFMLQQLRISSEHMGMSRPLPPMEIGEVWRAERLADLKASLAITTKHRAEETERTASRQGWVDSLRASLPPKEY